MVVLEVQEEPTPGQPALLGSVSTARGRGPWGWSPQPHLQTLFPLPKTVSLSPPSVQTTQQSDLRRRRPETVWKQPWDHFPGNSRTPLGPSIVGRGTARTESPVPRSAGSTGRGCPDRVHSLIDPRPQGRFMRAQHPARTCP